MTSRERAPVLYPILPVQKLNHISILHNILLPFRSDLAQLARFAPTARVEELLPVDDLGADELCFKIAVDGRARFGRRGTIFNSPRARLVLARSKEGDEAKQFVARADKPVDSILKHAVLLAELLFVVRMELAQLALDVRVHHHPLGVGTFKKFHKPPPTLVAALFVQIVP